MSLNKPKKKNYYRRNKSNILLLVLLVMIAYLCFYYDVFQTLSVETDFHVRILTINSVFAGFLFTSLGIMISILDKERILKLDKAGYMDNYFNAIYIGLFFHVLSISMSLLLIIIPGIDNHGFLIRTEQIFLFMGVSFFVKSIINVLNIIKMVRQG
ncbi:hypothetical protein [Oceanobacillus timonensis]|uniref:hypothetical protein n=1 Tax=Oceanobacillus timonensis TaxID=1926285 RepID=UPI0009BAFCB4|nr:hypothetical protein [Oceanobacillus timonensis]